MRLVGRRVRIIKAADSVAALGRIGAIIKVDRKVSTIILVKIKDWNQGHNGDLLNRDSQEYWWFSREDLRLIPRKKRGVR